ncbi:DUF1641 domain-containing protein [Acidipila sp. EB88]|uniref:DUF1641 domain-containing protein n=1 Tax=Acidipila sp. EB88 TaxID=2305226 RepID=UPI000F5FF9BC|nr:DUF1641 domain-containing protein [Acidipila sp. EB88]RRA47308.1 DUF1641 domain-containing protein [Acidipila sp. EB88]
MAKAVTVLPVIKPAKEETERKLEAAPLQHAEALLDAYRTLQTLHDTHTLEVVRGLLGAGDQVLTEVVSVATSPQSTRAIRNLLILTNLLGTVDPDALHRITSTVTPVLTETQASEPPSLFAMVKRLFSADVRRAMGTGLSVLEAVGRALGPGATKK